MITKKFSKLVRWELEEYLSLPVLGFIIASAILAVLIQNSRPFMSYINIYFGSGNVFLVLTFVAGAFFSRSFAGSFGRGEIKLLLSYPIKRWQVFLSKFTTWFVLLFVIYGATYSLHLYLDGLSLFEPLFYLSLFAFLLQLMLVCGISIAVSMVTRNEIMSMMSSVLLLVGIDGIFGTENFLSAQGRFWFLFQYFGKLIRGSQPLGDDVIVTANDIVMAVSVPVLIFVFLFILSFVYFIYFMEVD
ncbi:MAG: ABC transporter permease subunit [Candidatus Bathyarchaeota archaeon]|jgi:ABC-type transport system involved in multi-copper enzyme maturation permease subunit